MYVVNELIERKKKDENKLYLGFLDTEKAYYKVNGELLCNALEKVGLSNKIVSVGEDKVCVLLYADDVVVMSKSAEELQELLDVVNEYGRDFGVKFSHNKSQVMVLNCAEGERLRTWRIGDTELEQTKKYKYLGVYMSQNECEKTNN